MGTWAMAKAAKNASAAKGSKLPRWTDEQMQYLRDARGVERDGAGGVQGCC